MATIIVENGSIVANANSYVSAADLSTFAADRGITLTGTPAVLIIQSMDYIESLQYKGIKKTEDQPLQWPRIDVFVDGYYVNSDVIPNELKNAQMQTAIAIDQGNDPLALLTQNVKREKVDVIEIEYQDGSSMAPVIKKINSAIYKLLANGGGAGGNVIAVSKA